MKKVRARHLKVVLLFATLLHMNHLWAQMSDTVYMKLPLKEDTLKVSENLILPKASAAVSRAADTREFQYWFDFEITSPNAMTKFDKNNYMTFSIQYENGGMEVIAEKVDLNYTSTTTAKKLNYRSKAEGRKLEKIKIESRNTFADNVNGTITFSFSSSWESLWWNKPCPTLISPEDFINEDKTPATRTMYGYNATLTIKKVPINPQLTSSPDGVLSSESSTYLKTNFHSFYIEAYDFEWYYNYHATGGTWHGLGAESSIYIGASSLEEESGANFMSNLMQEKPLYIRASNVCISTSDKDNAPYANTISLTLKLDAPALYSYGIKPTSPKCAGGNDGKVKIPLRRKLYPSEKLQAALENVDDPLAGKPSVTLSNEEDTIYFDKLSAGNYKISYINGSYVNAKGKTIATNVSNEYAHKAQFTIKDPAPLSLSDLNKTDVHCKGGADGVIGLVPTGGTGTIYAQCNASAQTYSLTRDKNSFISGLSAGQYKIRLKDDNNCYMENSDWQVNIAEPIKKVDAGQYSKTEPTGFGLTNGAIEVVVSGGTGKYSYIWEKNGQKISEADARLSNVGAGEYTLIVRDENYMKISSGIANDFAGCQDSVEIVLQQPEQLLVTINVLQDISCHGFSDGSLEVIATGGVGGYRYEWYKSVNGIWTKLRYTTSEAFELDAGTYQVYVFDKNEIRASAEYTLLQPAPLSVAFKTTEPSCHGGNDGKVEALVRGGNGGYTYMWPGYANTDSVIFGEAQDYVVRVQDRKGCRAENNVTVGQPSELVATFEVSVPSSANSADGSITVFPSGGTPGYTYCWDYHKSTSNPLVNIPADSIPYHVIVKDAHGCEAELSPWVIYPLEVSLKLKDSISCYNGTDGVLEALVRGGVGTDYHYDWYRLEDDNLIYVSSGKFGNNLSVGIYRVQVTDKQGATVWSTDYNLTQPDRLTVNVRTEAVTCYGGTDGKAIAAADGGTIPYQYLWTHGDRTQEAADLQAGRYLVMVTDSRGCLAEAIGEVTSPEKLKLEYEITGLLCKGNPAEIRLQLSGGTAPYSANWHDGFSGVQRNGLYAGTYTVVVTDDYGCRKEETFVLEEVEEVSVDLGEDMFLCRDQQKELKALSNWEIVSYRWFLDGQPVATSETLNADKAGLYRLEVMTEEGCPGSGEVRVHETDVEIGCNFAMASKTEIGSHLKIVNTSLPAPEYCEWIVPDLAAVSVDKEQEDLLELVIGQTGTYTIGLKAVSGACEKYLYKDVTVMEEGTGIPVTRGEERLISDVRVWPNPNRGHFRMRVNLEKTGDGFLRLYASTGVLLREVRCEGNDVYEYSFNETLPVGVYILHVIFGKEREAVKIVVE